MMSNIGELQAQNSQEMSMSTTLPNKNPLSYVGVRAKNPPDLIQETHAPLSSDISGPNGLLVVSRKLCKNFRRVTFTC